MNHIVLDASAAIAFFRVERGHERVEQVLRGREFHCHMHAINAIEVYYQLARKIDKATALRMYDGLYDLGITVEATLSRSFQLRCATLKMVYPSLSLADTAAIALAETLDALVLTTDQEFDRALDIVAVEQLRPR